MQNSTLMINTKTLFSFFVNPGFIKSNIEYKTMKNKKKQLKKIDVVKKQ